MHRKLASREHWPHGLLYMNFYSHATHAMFWCRLTNRPNRSALGLCRSRRRCNRRAVSFNLRMVSARRVRACAQRADGDGKIMFLFDKKKTSSVASSWIEISTADIMADEMQKNEEHVRASQHMHTSDVSDLSANINLQPRICEGPIAPDAFN